MEESPLIKDINSKYKLTNCCGGGFKFIVSCFFILSFAITAILILQLFYGDNAPQDKSAIHGAVATDYTNCSQIGTIILRKGGNAIDAAVAATICMTVVAPHKTGLGGGGYIMVYDHRKQESPVVIDFASNTITDSFAAINKRIPAVLKGLEFTHTLYGKLPWFEIIDPSVKLARKGFVVSKEFAYEISTNSDYGKHYGNLNAGDILRLDILADTLSIIAQHGTDVLYNGTLSHSLYDEPLSDEQLQDLANYKPKIGAANNSTFYGYVVHYPLHVFSLSQLIEALNSLHISTKNASNIEMRILVVEALISSGLPVKYTEQERYTGVMAMDWQDIYVCILTGLSTPLRLEQMTSLGFLSDKSADYNTLSAFIPIIFHNKEVICGLRGIFGTNDPYLACQILYNFIISKSNVSTAIEYPRYFLLSDRITVENDEGHAMDTTMRNKLSSIITVSDVNPRLISKSVNAIIKQKDSMTSHSDSRGGGLSSRF